MLFQPHRYSRTRDLLHEFRDCFQAADVVRVVDIYAASETPIPGVDALALVEAMDGSDVRYSASFEKAVNEIVRVARPGDLVLTMGAGNIYQAAAMVLADLAASSAYRAPEEKPMKTAENGKKPEK